MIIPVLTALLGLWTSMAPLEAPSNAVNQHHVFYLHGRIVEDGLPAVSPQFGEYQYHDILSALDTAEITVHAKVRTSDISVGTAADEVLDTITLLLSMGVAPDQITVIGASKGAYIASLVSHRSANKDLRFVLLAGCSAGVVQYMLDNDIHLYGDILAVRDVADTEMAGSCEDIFNASPGIGYHTEVITRMGNGHGLIYRPYKEWMVPALKWVLAPAV
ncbi:MAG: hypothetical protein AAGA69_04250 [Pseudomonadota bacterium]